MSQLQALWDEFLAIWPLSRIEQMSLPEYTATQDKTTFTYWVETQTQPLANIKGSPSTKFGIYKRDPAKEAKDQSGMLHGEQYSWRDRFGDTEKQAFTAIRSQIIQVIQAAQRGDLDAIEEVSLAPVYKWKIAFLYQNQAKPCIVNIFAKDKLAELTALPKNAGYPAFYRQLTHAYSAQVYDNIAEYGRECWMQLAQDSDVDENGERPSALQPQHNEEQGDCKIALNQILYGPPGTGKTYHTIEAAVKAAEPTFRWTTREQLKTEYDRLVSQKRIRFVTFHQSYGYEEFVEGMRAISNEDNQIEYHIQPGVFKQICFDAAASVNHQFVQFNAHTKIWKLSIDGVKDSKVRDYCFEHGFAAIGWGETGDMSSENRSADQRAYFEHLGPLAKSSVLEFSSRMAEGDIVVCVKGQWSIQAVGVVSGDYRFCEQGIEDRADFCHLMPVKWLATELDVNLYELNENTRLTLKTCYELTRFTSEELFSLLEKNGVQVTSEASEDVKKNNYVLVIDEINRGNISKIFGELITLIEPSKRKGEGEALVLTLPYSGKTFSVPNNLYIIGTMNTADRSLAMMDTALRRRFDFVEMMPKPELLAGIKVQGIDLQRLLYTLNQRIEILYDREHALGHAFFMPIKTLVEAGEHNLAFEALITVFKNKVIPLLEEYFFEDWSKIRLVLADNQKPVHLQFIAQHTQNVQELNALFGIQHSLEQYGQQVIKYTLASDVASVWLEPTAYQAIYQAVSNEISNELLSYSEDAVEQER